MSAVTDSTPNRSACPLKAQKPPRTCTVAETVDASPWRSMTKSSRSFARFPFETRFSWGRVVTGDEGDRASSDLGMMTFVWPLTLRVSGQLGAYTLLSTSRTERHSHVNNSPPTSLRPASRLGYAATIKTASVIGSLRQGAGMALAQCLSANSQNLTSPSPHKYACKSAWQFTHGHSKRCVITHAPRKVCNRIKSSGVSPTRRRFGVLAQIMRGQPRRDGSLFLSHRRA